MLAETRLLSETGGNVAVRAQGTGAPVVLLHGVGLQSAAWQPQIAALAPDHHVLALDLPGHGMSAGLGRGARLPDFVDWLRRALDALQLGPVNLVGHSLGALIAAGYAIEHPEQVSRLALLNGVFRRSANARAEVEARADEIAQGRRDIDSPLARWFGDASRERSVCACVRQWLSEVDQGGYATAYAAFARGDDIYADRFATLACPLLALTGSDDPNSTPEMSRAMASAARSGVADVIEGHRHMVNLTAPDAVNRSLRDWLDRPLDGRGDP